MKLDTLKANAPIILYALFYTVFSLIGITLFYTQNELYLLLYERFSAVARPILSTDQQKWDFFLIAYIVPTCFILSFYISSKKIRVATISLLLDNFLDFNKTVCLSLYSIVAGFVLYRIMSVIDFKDILYAYTNYNVMIGTRFLLFDKLTTWDWILIYSCIPTLTGLLFYKLQTNFAKYSIMIISTVILLYTMQKRYIVLMLIFIYFVGLLLDRVELKKVLLRSFYFVTTLAFIFFIQTFLPMTNLFTNKDYKTHTMQRINQESVKVESVAVNSAKRLSEADLAEIQLKINANALSKFPTIELNIYRYLGAFVNRTSIPMAYFFELFPYKRDYLGNWLGCFFPYQETLYPYEGHVVWEYVNGDTPGGLAAPFNFSLYSRVGALGTVIITLILGISLGVGWGGVKVLQKRLSSAMLSSMFYILMIFLSMDNFKYSVFASYGIFWWVLCFFIVCILSRLVSYCRGVSYETRYT